MTRLLVRRCSAPPFIAISALTLLGACGGTTTGTVSLQSAPTPRALAAEPGLVVLGTRSLGTVANHAAGWAVTDSVLTNWGWSTAGVDTTTRTLRTGWLYADGPDFLPSSLQRCADARTVVAMRVIVTARPIGDHRTEFFVHGDTRVPSGTDGTAASRLARQGWDDVARALQIGIATADTRRAAALPSVQRVSAEAAASTNGGWNLCGTIRS